MKNNALLIDFDPGKNWNFAELLEKKTNDKWIVIKSISNLNQGSKLQALIRYIKYFLFPLKVLIKRNRFRKILAWQQFYGLIYAFYTRLFNIKKSPDIYIMTFIYKKKNGVMGKIYKRFIQFSLGSPFIKRVFVFSSKEPVYYSNKLSLDIELFSSIKLGVEDETNNIEKENDGYFLSVGRSNRDYEFLINNWKDHFGKLVIITDESIQTDKLGDNIELVRNCYGEDYYNYLLRCYAVVLPMKDVNISSGELVTIQAGMFGKPVISTYNKSLEDYIKFGVNGFLVCREDLEKYIDYIKNGNHYSEICLKARAFYETNFSLDSMAEAIASFFE